MEAPAPVAFVISGAPGAPQVTKAATAVRHSLRFVLAAAVVAGCAGSSTGPGAVNSVPTRRVSVVGPAPAGEVVGFASRLFAISTPNPPEAAGQLVQSTDGVHWARVVLPEHPPTMRTARGPQRVGPFLTWMAQSLDDPTPGVFASAREPLWAWVTRDGTTWRGGLVASDARSYSSYGEVFSLGATPTIGVGHRDRTFTVSTLSPAGRWVPTTISGFDGEATLRSTWISEGTWTGSVEFPRDVPTTRHALIASSDRGAHWSVAECTGLDPACDSRREFAGLTFRGEQVSTDLGDHWSPVRISPRPSPDLEEVSFTSATRTDDGWLATARAAPPSDRSYGFLLASADGKSWTVVTKDPCPEQGNGRPNSSYSPPVRLAGRWWTLYRCIELNDPAITRVLASNPSPSQWRTAVDLHAARAESLVVVGDRLAVPIETANRFGGTVDRVLVIEP